jgi:hypothetical protein
MNFNDLLEHAPKNLHIFNGLLKARSILERHRKIAVSVSGGSDSDTIMDSCGSAKNTEWIRTA